MSWEEHQHCPFSSALLTDRQLQHFLCISDLFSRLPDCLAMFNFVLVNVAVSAEVNNFSRLALQVGQ